MNPSPMAAAELMVKKGFFQSVLHLLQSFPHLQWPGQTCESEKMCSQLKGASFRRGQICLLAGETPSLRLSSQLKGGVGHGFILSLLHICLVFLSLMGELAAGFSHVE